MLGVRDRRRDDIIMHAKSRSFCGQYDRLKCRGISYWRQGRRAGGRRVKAGVTAPWTNDIGEWECYANGLTFISTGRDRASATFVKVFLTDTDAEVVALPLLLLLLLSLTANIDSLAQVDAAVWRHGVRTWSNHQQNWQRQQVYVEIKRSHWNQNTQGVACSTNLYRVQIGRTTNFLTQFDTVSVSLFCSSLFFVARVRNDTTKIFTQTASLVQYIEIQYIETKIFMKGLKRKAMSPKQEDYYDM